MFLTLDHLNNDGGGRNRVSNAQQIAKLRNLGWPKNGYGLACFNCNTGRYINGGVCPHQQTQEERE